MRKRLVNKIARKRLTRKCHFCPESQYELLDIHRIIPGDSGPGYIESNIVCSCANCHRKIHAGIIKVFRKYFSTRGWVLHYIDENSVEHFD